METFTTIINVTQDPVYPPTVKTYKGANFTVGPHSPPQVPLGTSLTFEPSQIVVEKSPPTSNGSWEEIKRSGTIVMSPYFHRKTSTMNQLASCNERSWFVRAFEWTDGSVSPSVCAMKEFIRLRSFWSEQGDSRYWTETKGVPLNPLNALSAGDVTDAISTSQTSVMAAFKGGFDALTQAAESREALSYFGSKTDEARSVFASLFGDVDNNTRAKIKDYGNAQDLLRDTDRNARKLGRRWMEYRYAIMPLLYAYKDVKQLYENVGRTYQTFKSKERIELNAQWPQGLPIRQVLQRSTGTVDVCSTIVAGYAPSGLNSYVSSQLQSNIFATAWELVPLSFVLDWFVNVGDYVTAKTSFDLSLQHQGCTSVRKRILLEEVLHDFRDVSLVYNRDVATVCNPSGVHLKESFFNSSLLPLKNVVLDHYDRILFDTNSLRLAFDNDPFGDWRRLADAAALSHQPLKKLLRRFT